MKTTKPIVKAVGLLAVMSLSFVPSTYAQGNGPSPEDNAVPAATPEAVAPATPSDAKIKLLTNYVESGGSYMTLTNGYGNWYGGYTRAVYQRGNDVWNGEINGQQQFGDSGVYFAAGDTHTFNEDWYGALTLGTSAGGFFWPRYVGTGMLNRKWLHRKQWITTGGFSYFAAKDVHRDSSVFLGTTYYFEKPWILEEGAYFNISNPGAVFAPAGFVAITQGRDKQQYITLRVGYGEEAYQLIGPTITLSQFNSQTVTITWRRWMGTAWGINFMGDYYRSPYYMRGGSSFGFFKEF